ncbi:hypothetical protein BLNAU_11815 [Blattamonas nauphoetae]|uniref:Uncharacterized protein n=1 Tax=Blattamonas nauphoetae TaxID=2049346 RepID=A0ABQ9XPR7_9EUKA|nr:hypothetical protein BLNAU_11815 [Blattamonas nauphoetae]
MSQQCYFSSQRVIPAIGEDEELWRSIQETPDWIDRDGAAVSPFTTLVDPTLEGDDYYQAIYVNGQRGTGKSQMLLYLLYNLMQRLEKVHSKPSILAWGRLEFYAMLQCLRMTGREHWIRAVTANAIIKLHPLVIRMLGAHGCVVDESGDTSEEEDTDGSEDEGASRSNPITNMKICLNVIEVFGLNPRALSAFLHHTFHEMRQLFGKTGITLDEKEMSSAFIPLIASHLSNQPVSVFTSRLLALATRLQENRCSTLKHDISKELFRSHVRFTVFSATPERLRSFQCTLPLIQRCALESSQLGRLQAFESNVLYYEAPWDTLKHTERTYWKGIDYFIFFRDEDGIKLFAFQNTVNAWQKDLNFELIERLKTLLENQHANTLSEARRTFPGGSKKNLEAQIVKVDVFFLWIVRPDHVEPFLKQTVVFPDSPRSDHDWTSRQTKSRVCLPYNTGVVSVADLLLSIPSALDEAQLPFAHVRWDTRSQDFRDCFVMKRDLTVDPDDIEESTSEGEADDLREMDEEKAKEDILPPRKVSKRKGKW